MSLLSPQVWMGMGGVVLSILTATLFGWLLRHLPRMSLLWKSRNARRCHTRGRAKEQT